MTDFKDHPVSITERKSDLATEDSGTLWTPRDVLIKMLRQIDNGEIEPDALIVCYREVKGDEISYKQSSPSLYLTMGIMEAVKILMLR